MYCSRCGSLIAEELNFCSRCGERVNKTELAESSKKQSEMLDNLAITAIFIGLGGLGCLVGLVAILLGNGVIPQVLVLIVLAYLAAWFGVSYKLLGQISKLVDANLERKKSKENEPYQASQISARRTAQLESVREPIASVTENTTRTLDEVLVEKK